MLTWLVRSAMVAYFPRTETLPGLEDCDVDAYLERVRAETTWLLWLGIVVSALVFHLTPIVTIRVPLLATMLSPEKRDAHAHALATTDLYLLRQLALLARMFGGLCWGTDPRVRARFAMPPLGPDPGTWRTS